MNEHQGSDEWRAARCGKVTASEVSKLITLTKKGELYADGQAYIDQLFGERMSGRPEQKPVSKAMHDGREREPLALEAYEFRTGNTVELVGFLDHPSIDMAGGSPDGLIGSDGMVEFKCPTQTVHYRYFRGLPIPDEYMAQIQWNLAVTGRQWCHWVSFYPDAPDASQLVIRRVDRDDNLIADMEARVSKAIAEINDMVRLASMVSEAA